MSRVSGEQREVFARILSRNKVPPRHSYRIFVQHILARSGLGTRAVTWFYFKLTPFARRRRANLIKRPRNLSRHAGRLRATIRCHLSNVCRSCEERGEFAFRYYIIILLSHNVPYGDVIRRCARVMVICMNKRRLRRCRARKIESPRGNWSARENRNRQKSGRVSRSRSYRKT